MATRIVVKRIVVKPLPRGRHKAMVARHHMKEAAALAKWEAGHAIREAEKAEYIERRDARLAIIKIQQAIDQASRDLYCHKKNIEMVHKEMAKHPDYEQIVDAQQARIIESVRQAQLVADAERQRWLRQRSREKERLAEQAKEQERLAEQAKEQERQQVRQAEQVQERMRLATQVWTQYNAESACCAHYNSKRNIDNGVNSAT